MPKVPVSIQKIESTAALAAKLGLSRWAVSRALNGRPGVSKSTAARIRAALTEHQFEPDPLARALRGGSSSMVAVCFPRQMLVADASIPLTTLAGSLAEGLHLICKILDENGLNCSIMSGKDSTAELESLRRARALRSSAVLLVGPQFSAEALAAGGLDHTTTPYVSIDPAYDLPFTAVKTDYGQAARIVLEHLQQFGHKRVALLGMDHGSFLYRAFEAASASLGFPARGLLRSLGVEDLPGTPVSSVALGWALVDLLLRRRLGVSALVAANDEIAFGALSRLRQDRKRVPQDYSIVGCGNLPLSAYCDPPLTTIDLQSARVFEQAGRTLCEQIRLGAHIETREILINPLFYKRASTGPAQI